MAVIWRGFEILIGLLLIPVALFFLLMAVIFRAFQILIGLLLIPVALFFLWSLAEWLKLSSRC